jgi:hypothetical protein
MYCIPKKLELQEPTNNLTKVHNHTNILFWFTSIPYGFVYQVMDRNYCLSCFSLKIHSTTRDGQDLNSPFLMMPSFVFHILRISTLYIDSLSSLVRHLTFPEERHIIHKFRSEPNHCAVYEISHTFQNNL